MLGKEQGRRTKNDYLEQTADSGPNLADTYYWTQCLLPAVVPFTSVGLFMVASTALGSAVRACISVPSIARELRIRSNYDELLKELAPWNKNIYV